MRLDQWSQTSRMQSCWPKRPPHEDGKAMRLWPRRKKDEGGTPPYRPLSDEAFSRCVADAWEVIQEWDPRRQTVRGRWWWNKAACLQCILLQAVVAKTLDGLDQAAQRAALVDNL